MIDKEGHLMPWVNKEMFLASGGTKAKVRPTLGKKSELPVNGGKVIWKYLYTGEIMAVESDDMVLDILGAKMENNTPVVLHPRHQVPAATRDGSSKLYLSRLRSIVLPLLNRRPGNSSHYCHGR